MDIMQISCIFHGLILLAIKLDPILSDKAYDILYSMFKYLSIATTLLILLFAKMYYISYIIPFVLIGLYIYSLTKEKKAELKVSAKMKIYEIALWLLYIVELLFYESLFQNIMWF